MNINFLRSLDRWLGPSLLLILVPLAKLISPLLRRPHGKDPKDLSYQKPFYVFIKLKGGGSLIIALPALLALRQSTPEASFILICTEETKIYAELTGIFDRYLVIDDRTPFTLIKTAIKALKNSFQAKICFDLEPNSILTTVFTLLTLAKRRFGFVKQDEPYAKGAFTEAIAFDVLEPIYIYYDELASRMNLPIASLSDCREQILRQLKPPVNETKDYKTIGLAPFTSEFARERMMPSNVWLRLLEPVLKNEATAKIIIFGSAKNRQVSNEFTKALQNKFAQTTVLNYCGQRNLTEAAADILSTDEMWAIDSGLLHITRILHKKCRSFWGPSDPKQRLRPIEGLDEVANYRYFACSPCVHTRNLPPCGGNNLCMITMADPSPNLVPPWCTEEKIDENDKKKKK